MVHQDPGEQVKLSQDYLFIINRHKNGPIQVNSRLFNVHPEKMSEFMLLSGTKRAFYFSLNSSMSIVDSWR